MTDRLVRVHSIMYVSEQDQLVAKAKDARLSLSEWIRQHLIDTGAIARPNPTPTPKRGGARIRGSR